MDAQAEVAARVQERLGCVETHPNSELEAFRPIDCFKRPLHAHGCRDRIRCTVEGGEVRVALRVDDVSCVGSAGVLDQAAVLSPDLSVPGSQ